MRRILVLCYDVLQPRLADDFSSASSVFARLIPRGLHTNGYTSCFVRLNSQLDPPARLLRSFDTPTRDDAHIHPYLRAGSSVGDVAGVAR